VERRAGHKRIQYDVSINQRVHVVADAPLSHPAVRHWQAGYQTATWR
jgi:hypothetical protein